MLQGEANRRILIVDDQREIHDDFEEMLGAEGSRATDQLAAAFLDAEQEPRKTGFALLHATSGEGALELVEQAHGEGAPIAVAFVDVRMPPGIDGIETVRRIRRIDSRVEIVIMTAYTDKRFSDIVQHIELLHKLLYVRKPFAREEMQQIAESLVYKWNLERELDACRDDATVAKARLEALLRAAKDPIAFADPTGRLVASNHRYDELRPATETAPALPDDLHARLEARFPNLKASQEPPSKKGELVLRQHPDATNHIFLRTTEDVYDQAENPLGTLTILRDITSEVERLQHPPNPTNLQQPPNPTKM